MTITRRKIIILTGLFLLFVLAAGTAVFFVKELYHLDAYKVKILAELQKTLNRDVRYEKGEFSLLYGPSFNFSQVVVKERDNKLKQSFITVDLISFRLALLPLLGNRVVVKDIILEKPSINLTRYRDGSFNISDLMEEKRERQIQVKGLHIHEGSLTITDQFISDQGVVHRIGDLDLYLSNLTRGKKTKFAISALIMDGRQKGEINLKGRVMLTAEDQSLFDSLFDANVTGKHLNAEHYWDYYRPYVPFQKLRGYLDVESSFQGKLKGFEAEGKMAVKGLRFDYPGVFHAVLSPKDIQIKYSMATSPQEVEINDIDVKIDSFHATGSCAIRDIPSRDPLIVARATTGPFKIEKYFQYIPFGIIPKTTSEFIEKKIKAGTCRLDEGRLDGRVSQIASLWEKDNARVLSIQGTVLEGGLLRLNEQVPSFNNLKGNLSLEGKNFTLRNISGKFGKSPFTMNGAITDYCLKTPQSYPFSMTMVPQRDEVAWLLGENTGSKLSFSGASNLRLNGRGFADDYQLFGDWILKNAAYRHDQLINKPAGKDNHIAFSGSLNHQGFKVKSFQYKLPPMALTLSARYTWDQKEIVFIEANSNRFLLESVANYFPEFVKYQPQGDVQIAIRGEGNAHDPIKLKWHGGVSLNGASFVLAEKIKAINNVTGIINIKGGELETSRISARIGTSPVTGKVGLIDFKNPSLNLDFSCPNLELSDLGLSSPSPEKKVTGIKGNITWRDESLYINSLSGRLDNSSFQVKGKVTELRKPIVDIQGTSPYLEMKDVLTLAGIRKAGPEKEPGEPPLFKASIAVDKGKWQNIQFTELRSDLNFDKEVLNLQKIDFATMNGKVSAKGRVDFNEKVPKYDITFAADKISSEELAKAFDLHQRQMTGSLAIQGELTAQGDHMSSLKKTASGAIKLKASKGTLKQFPGLSKMFSILNVSQLFKFQLPDMVSGGMPYNEINANLNFQDGIVETKDLYVRSDAMNIAVVAKIDMVREEIDGVVGIQPLQTVDKVVSSIPVIGWIITGKEGTFVTVYFETKGKLNSPTVTAIPLQSTSSAVFDIFKRTFQLPVKIFTNTGEVFLGK